VLVVDDSALGRESVAGALSACDGLEVVGRASDGEHALRLCDALRPDAVTLDLVMPRMDGFTFLRLLMRTRPTPVVVVSGSDSKEHVFRALELGAVDFVTKTRTGGVSLRAELVPKLLVAPELAVRPRRPSGRAPPRSEGAPASWRRFEPRHVIAVAGSTGGPAALSELVAHLPDRFRGALVIAQHLPAQYTRAFAERLDQLGPLRFAEALDGEPLVAGRGYVCPGRHRTEIGVGSAASLVLRVRPSVGEDRYAPSADRLLESAAAAAGTRAVGVVLSGMGDDGARGAAAIRAAGGLVLVESRTTAVVYGMPGAAIRAGAASEVLSRRGLAKRLATLG
jgi:two-component system chemotaxis response regulator CheB